MPNNSKDCTTCEHALLCPTWTTYKCTVKKEPIYDPAEMAACKEYKKGTPSEDCHCDACEERRGEEE